MYARRVKQHWLAVVSMVVFAAPAAALDIHRYTLRATVLPPAKTVEATVEIEFAPIERVRLKASAMTIRSVSCGGRSIEFVHANDDLSFDPAAATACSIEYATAAGRGLVINDEVAYTVFHTDRWMPSNPDISDRARFAASITAPDGFRAVTTDSQRDFPAYLFGFAVGRFHTTLIQESGPAIAVHAVGVDEEGVRKAFATAPEMLKFFEGIAGMPYPSARYDQVVMPGAPPQELAGGTLLSTEYVKSVIADPTEDYLIAHELSHQWWGNVLTGAGWREFWLHEGFATYMVALWKQYKWSQAAYDEEIALASVRLRRAWASKKTALVSAEATTADRALVYSRGALVLHAVRRRVGDRAFYAGIRSLGRTGARRPLRSSDFCAAMSISCEKWIARAELPEVTITYALRGRELILTTTQAGSVFDLRFEVHAGTTSRMIETKTARQTTSIRLPRGELLSLHIDGRDTLLGSFRFERPEKLVLAQLRSPDRLTRLGAIEDALRVGTPALREELAKMAASDPSRAVRRAAAP
jgi:aminopeptidase N